MGARPAVTLKALAAELGLNPATVSRVLNDPKGLGSKWASPDTTERIFALAEERGYRKNPYAASLRTAKSHMIGVVVPRLQDYVLATMYEGIDEAASEHGYFTVVSNSLDDAAAHRAKAEKLLDRRADGLIFGDALFEDPFLDELAERGVAFTLVSRRSPGHRSVTCDDYAGGRMVAEHLVASGRRTFGLIAGNPRASTSILSWNLKALDPSRSGWAPRAKSVSPNVTCPSISSVKRTLEVMRPPPPRRVGRDR